MYFLPWGPTSQKIRTHSHSVPQTGYQVLKHTWEAVLIQTATTFKDGHDERKEHDTV